MLDLLRKHLDSKGKQAKLKSPQELQDLLDVTRELLAELDEPHKGSNPSEEKTDKDEIREKFRIVKVALPQFPANILAWLSCRKSPCWHALRCRCGDDCAFKAHPPMSVSTICNNRTQNNSEISFLFSKSYL